MESEEKGDGKEMSEIYPETPGKPDLGQVAYEAYCLASDGVSLVSGQPLPVWEAQAEDIRMAWRMSAGAVLITIDQHDEAAREPQPANVIIVTEVPIGDRQPVERRYAADKWDENADGVSILRAGHVVARYRYGAWMSARENDATVPDATARALGIAKRALEAVTRISDPNVAIKLATDALDEIFAELDL